MLRIYLIVNDPNIVVDPLFILEQMLRLYTHARATSAVNISFTSTAIHLWQVLGAITLLQIWPWLWHLIIELLLRSLWYH